MVIHHLMRNIFLVVIERGSHLFPFRTQKLSLSSPMVLHRGRCGRVGRCQDCNYISIKKGTQLGVFFNAFLVNIKKRIKKPWPVSHGFFYSSVYRLLPFCCRDFLLQSLCFYFINDFAVIFCVIGYLVNRSAFYDTLNFLGNCHTGHFEV